MNDGHFDKLTQIFGAASTRRRVFHGTVGFWLGLTMAPPALVTEAGKKRKRKRKRKKNKRNSCREGSPCGNGGVCRSGRCDHNVCTLDCASNPEVAPQPCGPAGSSCQCVNRGEGVGACVKSVQGMSCSEAVCDAGEICGISCTTYLPYCWAPCV